MFWFLAIPLGALIIYFAVFRLDYLLLLITFLTPFAINIDNLSFGLGLSLPTEPLLFGVLLLFVIRVIYEGYGVQILKHPISIAIIINLIWIFITSLTSCDPIVSLKFLLARLWFVVPFFFIGVMLFKNREKIKLFLWLYSIPLIVVIIYTLIRHVANGLSNHSSHWVMEPFYRDHTSYGAILAMFVPIIFGLSLLKYKTRIVNYIGFAFFGIIILGTIFSYTRAAWLSLAIAFGFLFILWFKIKFKYIIIIGLSIITIGLVFQEQIIMKLGKNRQDSSDNLTEHVQSISNISSDASNLERINRWSSALRMFKEKPFWGWGPGTYQFKYAPYQLSSEKTIISTNSGDMGNAHSEYIGPLAESGVFGMLSFIGIVCTIIYTGLRVYKNSKEKEVKVLSMIVLLGLITYMVHGLMNNFLDTDKASIPFWGFTAILVAFDIIASEKMLVTKTDDDINLKEKNL